MIKELWIDLTPQGNDGYMFLGEAQTNLTCKSAANHFAKLPSIFVCLKISGSLLGI